LDESISLSIQELQAQLAEDDQVLRRKIQPASGLRSGPAPAAALGPVRVCAYSGRSTYGAGRSPRRTWSTTGTR